MKAFFNILIASALWVMMGSTESLAAGEQCIDLGDGRCFQGAPPPSTQPSDPVSSSLGLSPGECPNCKTCGELASAAQSECGSLESNLEGCRRAAAQMMASGTASTVESAMNSYQVTSQCRQEFQSQIATCERVVPRCQSTCAGGRSVAERYAREGALISSDPTLPVRAQNELATISSREAQCQQGEVTLGALRTGEAALGANMTQILGILGQLAPSLVDLLLTGQPGEGDLCETLKRDLGEDHASTQAACGPEFNLAGEDPEPEDPEFGELPAPTAPNPMGSAKFTGQNFDGNLKGSKNGSSRAQEASSGSSGSGSPLLGAGNGSSSEGTTLYEGGTYGSAGYNTNIMGDPEGQAGGRRGAASVPRRGVQGQQSHIRAQAEAHHRAAQQAAQRRRELRGPHAQGLFESVSEAYKRYRHEMME